MQYETMIPLIIISNNNRKTNQYIKDFIKKNNLLSYLVFSVHPDKKEISIDQIREIKKKVVMSTSDSRLFILYSFDTASSEAQNALLKTLEENTKDNIFMLICENEEKVLPTIRSRSKTIIIAKNKATEKKDEKVNELFDLIFTSSTPSFLGHSLVIGINREKAITFIDNVLLFFQKKLADDRRASGILKKTLSTRSYLINNNLSPQLAVDSLLIFIWKQYNMS